MTGNEHICSELFKKKFVSASKSLLNLKAGS